MGRVQDLAKDGAAHYQPARRYYDSLALQLSQQEHALDVYACSLDQVGSMLPAHMKPPHVSASVTVLIIRPQECHLCFTISSPF